ncbi:hypothetical protein JYU34_009902 [Plutella xylostella]|uniref:Uncharacterized protein n=1 Tax=Plutella xylostella TaxID=51655 RepID=A0ABQ7QKM4_PLUXY|nr:hypothetical protein JYU34_009902 [Plutella xylostella]
MSALGGSARWLDSSITMQARIRNMVWVLMSSNVHFYLDTTVHRSGKKAEGSSLTKNGGTLKLMSALGGSARWLDSMQARNMVCVLMSSNVHFYLDTTL